MKVLEARDTVIVQRKKTNYTKLVIYLVSLVNYLLYSSKYCYNVVFLFHCFLVITVLSKPGLVSSKVRRWQFYLALLARFVKLYMNNLKRKMIWRSPRLSWKCVNLMIYSLTSHNFQPFRCLYLCYKKLGQESVHSSSSI